MSPARLEELYDAHADALHAFLLNLTRHESDAGDALQDVFVRLAARQDEGIPMRDERGYLLRMAHNRAVDLIRRRDTRTRANDAWAVEEVALFAGTADPDEALLRSELASALGELPPDQRAVVHLKLWEHLTFEEIARLLEIPLNTAASRYRYGLDKIRARLRPLFRELC